MMIEPFELKGKYHDEINISHDTDEGRFNKLALEVEVEADYGECRATFALLGDNVIKLRDWLNRYIEREEVR